MNFTKLNLPPSEIKLKNVNGVHEVFCLVRKKWLVLTPEEWVRQNFIAYLNTHLNYPLSLMQAEKEIKVHDLKKRFDLSCSNQKGELLLLAEFKSTHVKLSKSVFDQVARYNLALRVPVLIISNGMQHYCSKIDLAENSFEYLKNIPSFDEL